MSETKSWEKMTIAEQMDAARNRQASFKLEAEVRAAARARDLNGRSGFRFRDQGRPRTESVEHGGQNRSAPLRAVFRQLRLSLTE